LLASQNDGFGLGFAVTDAGKLASKSMSAVWLPSARYGLGSAESARHFGGL
jgi:hypothetical protein